MDSGTAALWVAIATGSVSLASKVVDTITGRSEKRSAKRQQASDAAYTRAEAQAAMYYKQLEASERDNAELRTRVQDLLDQIDKHIDEARGYRRTIAELRTEVNLFKTQNKRKGTS